MVKILLGNLTRARLRDAWKHEASDFTPWLSETENLNALADALGISELALVATEHWIGDFKLDMLCSDGNDHVIIENQLEKTDHTHLGQLIAYAAGVNAKKIIWVAESFRPEHAAALQFLNDNTTEDLNFFAVQIELWRIGDSPLAPKFEVIVKPNDWMKTGREQARAAASTTPTQQLQLSFWTALAANLTEKAPHIRFQPPRAGHFLRTSLGRSGFQLNAIVNKRIRKIAIELWLDGSQAKQHFADIFDQRADIENALGCGLDWQELTHANASKVIAWHSDAPLEDESRWPEYIDWLTSNLVKMQSILRPIVQALP